MTGERSWPELLIPRLQLLGEIFANALLRKQNEEQLFLLHKRLQNDNVILQEELNSKYDSNQIIGNSDALRNVLSQVKLVAPVETSVLIQGETGTGKELVARAIHNNSSRNGRPMIKVNCATLPASIIESELFGHQKGAFTGAATNRKGRFELADGATLFLDEIGELPLDLQPKLLRVLESGEFERLGESKSCQVNVRLITATNRNLEREVLAGRFREDLWHRLNVFLINVPPLRERIDDIPLLVSSFINTLNQSLGKNFSELSPETLKTLKAYTWPGNVRELQHVIERAMILSRGSQLQLADALFTRLKLPEPNLRSETQTQHFEGLQTVTQQAPLHEVEREYILRILERTYWRVHGSKGAANILGLNPSTLRARMKKLEIQRPSAKGLQ